MSTTNTGVAKASTNDLLVRRVEPVREYFTKLAGDDRFMKEASFFAQILANNEYLAKTDQASQLLAFQGLAESGLTLSPVHKLAYLVPRKGKCILEPSYMGLAKLITDTGSVRHIEVQVVYEGDECEIDMASDRKVLRHVPYAMRGVDKGEVRAFYSLAALADGSKHFEFMSRGDVDATMAISESYKAWVAKKVNSCVWVTNYEEMGRKTVLKRHCKHLPKTERWDKMAKAIDLDNSDYEWSENRPVRTQIAAAPSVDEAACEDLKEQVREALLAYEGEDKKKIKQDCVAFVTTGKVDPAFWAGMLKRLGGQPTKA